MNKSGIKSKILIVVPTLECGGLERNVSVICNNINTTKYDVTLAVLNNANQFFKITNDAVKVIDLNINNVRMSLFAILKLSRKLKPAIILATANHLNLYLAIFKWMFPKNIKIIARESSIVSVNTEHAPLPKLYHWLLRRFYKKLDMIICQSEYMRNDLSKNYSIPGNKMQIIYNAVNVPEINNTQHKVPFAKLVTVGRLSPEKGIDRLIKAVSLLKIPYRFTIIGEGNMRPVLQQQINELLLQDKIFLAGSHAKPFTVVDQPDLFLMGSHYEGFPNAMLEALAAGIPAVAFNAPGGIAELLINNENGLLVEGNNEALFAAKIEAALNALFDKKAIEAYTLQRFNINTIMNKWYDLFNSEATS